MRGRTHRVAAATTISHGPTNPPVRGSARCPNDACSCRGSKCSTPALLIRHESNSRGESGWSLLRPGEPSNCGGQQRHDEERAEPLHRAGRRLPVLGLSSAPVIAVQLHGRLTMRNIRVATATNWALWPLRKRHTQGDGIYHPRRGDAIVNPRDWGT